MAWLFDYKKVLLLDVEKFHIKDQGGIGRDHAPGTPLAVSQFRGDEQLHLAAFTNELEALRPTGNDLVETKNDGLIAFVGTIEFTPV